MELLARNGLTLSPPNKLSSAKFLVCFNIQSASMWLKFRENVKCQTAWIRWDAELLGVSSGSKLFAYNIIVVLGGLRVKVNIKVCWLRVISKIFYNIVCICINVGLYLTGTFVLSSVEHHETARKYYLAIHQTLEILKILGKSLVRPKKFCVDGNPSSDPVAKNTEHPPLVVFKDIKTIFSKWRKKKFFGPKL